METPSQQTESDFWNSEDQAILRQFLETRTGQKLLPAIAQSAPTLLDGKDVNQTLVRNGELRGFQFALQATRLLAYPPPSAPKETPAYPPLEDDSAWEGEKLNPPNK